MNLTKLLNPLSLVVTLLSLTCLLQADPQEYPINEATVTQTENLIANDTVKVVSINIAGMPAPEGFDLVLPAKADGVTLTVGQKMVLQLYPDKNYYESTFTFSQRLNGDTSILTPKLSNQWGWNYSWDHQPIKDGSLWWDPPYYQYWTATTVGHVVLKFEGTILSGGTILNRSLTLQVPVTVTK